MFACRMQVMRSEEATDRKWNWELDVVAIGLHERCGGPRQQASPCSGRQPISKRNADPSVSRPPQVRNTIRTQEVEPSEPSRSVERLTGLAAESWVLGSGSRTTGSCLR